MPDEMPPCVGERLRDALADLCFAQYEAAWEAAHPEHPEDLEHDQETQ